MHTAICLTPTVQMLYRATLTPVAVEAESPLEGVSVAESEAVEVPSGVQLQYA